MVLAVRTTTIITHLAAATVPAEDAAHGGSNIPAGVVVAVHVGQAYVVLLSAAGEPLREVSAMAVVAVLLDGIAGLTLFWGPSFGPQRAP